MKEVKVNNVRMVGNLNFVVDVFKMHWRPKLIVMIYYHFFKRTKDFGLLNAKAMKEFFAWRGLRFSELKIAKKVEYNF